MTSIRISRRQAARLILASIGAAGSAGIYALAIEPHWVETVHRVMPVHRLPEKLHGSTLVQLSDLHVGLNVDDGYILGVFEKVRALAPDIVAYTGDFITHHGGTVDQFRRIYAKMPLGRRATVAVFGNHDYGLAWKNYSLARELELELVKQQVQVLRNRLTDVDGLQIIGLDDFWAGRFSPGMAFSRLATQRPMLALSHNPDTVDLKAWQNFKGWILCGHTHGGQFKPPFLRPPVLPVKNKRYSAGEYQLPGERTLYINRGIGYLYKARFNARPEITVFKLIPA